MPLLIGVGALLVCAALISIAAAIIGSPIRLGRLSLPGPDGPVERAIAGVIGTVALAAIAPVAVLGLQRPAEPTVPATGTQNHIPIGSPDAIASTGPASSPTPSPPPRSTIPVPGEKTATQVSVSLATRVDCAQTASASVTVTNGPVTVSYAIYVNGMVRSPAPSPVTGSGTVALASTTVDVTKAGSIEYRILAPNGLSHSATWAAAAACQPALAITTPEITGGCADGSLSVIATLSVTAAASEVDVTYHLVVVGAPTPLPHTKHLVSDIQISDVITLPADIANGTVVTVFYQATSPLLVSSTPASVTLDCPSTMAAAEVVLPLPQPLPRPNVGSWEPATDKPVTDDPTPTPTKSATAPR